MICWLIAWAGHDEDTCVDKDLRDCGRQFVQALLNLKRGEWVRFRGDIKTEIRQQDKKIDILARINEKYVLLIEDKTVAKDREDKLERYYNAVITGETCFRKVVEKDIYPIYLKTGNQSLAEDKKIEKYGYKLFHRKDFLKVLKKYSGSHPILVDFREYLQGIEGRTESYCKWTKEPKRDTRNSPGKVCIGDSSVSYARELTGSSGWTGGMFPIVEGVFWAFGGNR